MGTAAFVFIVAVAMISIELMQPGRSWPHVSSWWARAAALNGIQVAFVYIAGVAWDGWMLRHRPWSAEALA